MTPHLPLPAPASSKTSSSSSSSSPFPTSLKSSITSSSATTTSVSMTSTSVTAMPTSTLAEPSIASMSSSGSSGKGISNAAIAMIIVAAVTFLLMLAVGAQDCYGIKEQTGRVVETGQVYKHGGRGWKGEETSGASRNRQSILQVGWNWCSEINSSSNWTDHFIHLADISKDQKP
ncbi:hypothetical protein DID88_000118 [Monilinia fructigena]|uniref:Uncharacterized protein n=1 Tax=Monilinia fructigena TaxID=38457 RepID=A0A395IIZ2_9HELO|nr:hypothetical protein DID88_000118 [Monilinia fructigena]